MFGLCIDLKKWWPILAHYFLSGKVNGYSLRKMFDFMLRCKCEAVTDVGLFVGRVVEMSFRNGART
jgi:hypothetical protein